MNDTWESREQENDWEQKRRAGQAMARREGRKWLTRVLFVLFWMAATIGIGLLVASHRNALP